MHDRRKAIAMLRHRCLSPDTVDEPEYRLVYDFVEGLLNDGADWRLVDAALHNVSVAAHRIHAVLAPQRPAT